MQSGESASRWGFPNPKKMSEHNSHIDDNFVPEGLEFREEYLHAALSSYRRRKRAIFWRRTGIAALAILIIGSVYLAPWNEPDIQSANETQSPASPKIDQQTNTNDTSSTLDLDMDEGFLSKDRLTAADETPGASQEKSKQAVDMGDPMSSGVGSPGRLSISESKIQKLHGQQSTRLNNDSNTIVQSESYSGSASGTQLSGEIELAGETSLRMDVPVAMSYLFVNELQNERELIPHRPLPNIENRKWILHAMLGAKLWANYGFGTGVRKIDPMLSLGAEYKWKKKIGIYLNAQCFTVSGISKPYVATQRKYAAGFEETSYSYHTDRFYHAGLSFGSTYYASKKHSIGLLYDVNYLITTDNRITVGNSSSYEATTYTEQKTKGYAKGFESIQHCIGLTYEYCLGRNKSVGATYRLGLSDVTKNAYFGNEQHRNSLFSLHLKMKLRS